MTEASDDDFESVETSLKCLKGVLVDSLRKVSLSFIYLLFYNIIVKKLIVRFTLFDIAGLRTITSRS